MRGVIFFYNTIPHKFRSTLKTVESLKWRASARPRARLLAARAKGACKDFSRVPSSLVLSVAQKVRKAKEQENNIRMNIKVKYSG